MLLLSARQVVRVLKTLAEHGRTVVFTIHQPAQEIYHEFDDLYVMTAGRVAYFGPGRCLD